MEKVTQTEEEAMMAVWKIGEGSVKSFMAQFVGDCPPYTTLASTVKNLERKGYLKGRLVGNTYLYTPVISEEAYRKRNMGQLVKNYFDNSYKSVVSFLVEDSKITTDELKEIIEMIEGKS
jgi:BlaI family transcriptional regulator, penicillinase repressor